MSGYDYFRIGDYPFLAVENCPDCDQAAIAVVERVVIPPGAEGPDSRGAIRTQLTILEICEHLTYDEVDEEIDEGHDLE